MDAEVVKMIMIAIPVAGTILITRIVEAMTIMMGIVMIVVIASVAIIIIILAFSVVDIIFIMTTPPTTTTTSYYYCFGVYHGPQCPSLYGPGHSLSSVRLAQLASGVEALKEEEGTLGALACLSPWGRWPAFHGLILVRDHTTQLNLQRSQ